MISVEQATTSIASHVRDLGSETVPLDTSVGRILRQRVSAERDQPPFDRVTMDGIAVSSAWSGRDYQVAGTSFAGDPRMKLSAVDACIEVMTGTALPEGCDTVVPVERLSIARGIATLNETYSYDAGQFVHRRGSDHAAGKVLLEPGAHLGATEIAVIATAGLPDISVGRMPRVCVVSTGNELVAAGQPIADHQVRLSNGPSISAALREQGIHSSQHHLVDSPKILEENFRDMLANHDTLILSGGVSMGKADHVPAILDKIGVERVFHKISQRPGKPMWFGVGTDGQLVFGLPGNPVSAMVCTRRYVLPALLGQSGYVAEETEMTVLGNEIDFKPALTGFLPVNLEYSSKGARARHAPTNTSGDFTALAGTAGLIELNAEQSHFPAETAVPFYRWVI